MSLALYVHLGPSMLLQIEALLALLLLPLAEGKAPAAAAGHGPGPAELQQVGCQSVACCCWELRRYRLHRWPVRASPCRPKQCIALQAKPVPCRPVQRPAGQCGLQRQARPRAEMPLSPAICSPQVALEGVLDFCAQPSFVRDVYLNLDCRCAPRALCAALHVFAGWRLVVDTLLSSLV